MDKDMEAPLAIPILVETPSRWDSGAGQGHVMILLVYASQDSNFRGL